MRVLLNVTARELAFVGGDQSYYRTLAAVAQDQHFGRGFEAHALTHSSATWRHRVRLLEAVSRRVPLRGLKRTLFAESRRIPVARRDIEATQADLVFSTILVARVPRLCRVANVFYSQGINEPEYYAYMGGYTVEDVAAYYRRIAPHVTLMVVGTRDGLDRLQALCPDLPCKTLYVPQVVLLNPIAEPIPAAPDEPVKFLFVGRDYVRKGLPEVLDAMRGLAEAVELHIVTMPDCPLQQNAPPFYWYSNLSDNDLHDLYRRCHVLVVPTHADTYNLVLVEAMAFGCAIVTSDLRPMGEIVPDGTAGMCVPRGDRAALVAALQRLVADRAYLAQMRAGALQHYKAQYAPARVIPQLFNAFNTALAMI
ncbi:MAG TPA: glycosyltransferase family 4 protein [Aggregatilineaceae bacterium]|nr:glycosyltransferase family 4 protein [Aggregatilineaceae bacterium]